MFTIRPIERAYDKQVESLIRSCLIEFGGDHEGTAWMDPDLDRFSEVYAPEGRAYWVAVDDDDRVVAGCGICEVAGEPDVCELMKMYAWPHARGTGIAGELLDTALDFARGRYRRCYLETLDSMERAQRFYEKHGFSRTTEHHGASGHYTCDIFYIKDL